MAVIEGVREVILGTRELVWRLVGSSSGERMWTEALGEMKARDGVPWDAAACA